MTTDPAKHQGDPVDPSAYSLDVKAVAERVRAAGFQISERSASRWCQKNRLECILLPVDNGRIEQYFATPQSVDDAVEKMQRFQRVDMTSHSKPQQDMTSHGASQQDTSRQDDAVSAELTKIKEDNLNLTIDNRAKEQVISTLVGERKEMMDKLEGYASKVGQLETELRLAIEAPKEHQNSDNNTSRQDDEVT